MAGNIKSGVKIFNVTGSLSGIITEAGALESKTVQATGPYDGRSQASLTASRPIVACYAYGGSSRGSMMWIPGVAYATYGSAVNSTNTSSVSASNWTMTLSSDKKTLTANWGTSIINFMVAIWY